MSWSRLSSRLPIRVPAVLRTTLIWVVVFAFGVCALAQGRSADSVSDATQLTSQVLKTRAGLTLNYVVQGDASGPVIVMLHGAGDSWHSFDRVFSAASAALPGLRDHAAGPRPQRPPRDRLHLSRLCRRRARLSGADEDHPRDPRGALPGQLRLPEGGRGRWRLQRTAHRPCRADRLRSGPAEELRWSVRADECLRRAEGSGALHLCAGTSRPAPSTIRCRLRSSRRWSARPRRSPPRPGMASAEGIANRSRSSGRSRSRCWSCGARRTRSSSAPMRTCSSRTLPHARFSAYAETGHALHWERPERFTHDLLAFIAGK